jgi:site-specific DNA-methyltransferase (adenine-specific)
MVEAVQFRTGVFFLGDCFDVMATLPAGMVDMVLCDLPYGATQNKWDSVLPLGPLWGEYWRLLKSNGPAVLTAAQPFTTVLGASCVERLRYSLIWDKVRPVGHLNAKIRPMQRHEDVLIFAREKETYNPQGLVYAPKVNKRTTSGDNYGKAGKENLSEYTGYPQSILKYESAQTGKFHPTQKPVALFEYLIRTYTNPGELVLDNTAGSGTTAVAAIQSGRSWICIERDPEYFAKACVRVAEAEALTPANP